MSDSISIQFRNGSHVSVAFFSLHDGRALLRPVKEYLKELDSHQEENKGKKPGSDSLIRRDPETVMVDFIAWFLGKNRSKACDYCLGVDGEADDNSDNGNFVIDLKSKHPVEDCILKQHGLLDD
jgi:hypothetical protein